MTSKIFAGKSLWCMYFFAELWTLNHNTYHESTSTHAADGLKIVPRRALRCVCPGLPFHGKVLLATISLVLSLQTGLSPTVTEAKCAHGKGKAENMGKTIWMTIKSRSDGDFPARRTLDFPPDFLAQKEALWCSGGWQECLGSDPLRLFLPSFPNNVKVDLSSTASLLPMFGSKVQSRDQQQPWGALSHGLLHRIAPLQVSTERHTTLPNFTFYGWSIYVSCRHPHRCLAFQNAGSGWSWHQFFLWGCWRRM